MGSMLPRMDHQADRHGTRKGRRIQSWTSKNESLTWSANILKAGEYKISAIVESSGDGCQLDVTIAGDPECAMRKEKME